MAGNLLFKKSSILKLLFLATYALSSHALEFTVNDPEDLPDVDPGDGVALTERGTTSLRAAVEEANCLPGKDYINDFVYPVFREYAAGVYIDSPLYIQDDLEISIGRGVLYCVACGPNQYRAIEVATGVHLEMVGVYLQDGGPSSYAINADRGAGMYINPGANVLLNGCEFQSGTATEAGGGIYVDHAVLNAYWTSVTGYSKGDGGGIYNDHGFIYGENQNFLGTAEGRGGAIFNDHGYVVLNQSSSYNSITEGIAVVAGGGLYSEGGVITLNSARIINNSAGNGGGIYLADAATVEMFGCSFKKNTANDDGGAIYVESGSLWLTMCTFGQNTVGRSGGAVSLSGGVTSILNSTFTENMAAVSGIGAGGGLVISDFGIPLCILGNTIVAGNTALTGQPGMDIYGPFQSLGHNLVGVSEGGIGYVATDLLGMVSEPLAAILQYSSVHEGRPAAPSPVYIPQPGSPAIDAGDTSLLFNLNFMGSPCFDTRLSCCPRVRNGAVDIGAIEVQEGSIDLTCDGAHSADYDHNGRIGLSEVLRIVQFFNSNGFHCKSRTEDGYASGPGDMSCTAHSADYNPQDWAINLSELLRIVQFYNSPGYHSCIDGEDGFCVG